MTHVLLLPVLVTLIDGILMVAWQVYWAPCDVSRGLNVRVLVLVAPLTVAALSVTPALPTPPPLHWTVMSAFATRLATVVTVHVNWSSSPATPVVIPEIMISGSGRSEGKIRETKY